MPQKKVERRITGISKLEFGGGAGGLCVLHVIKAALHLMPMFHQTKGLKCVSVF